MAKEKKKTPLPKGSIMAELGYVYYEDIPEYHIDGRKCSKIEYDENLAYALSVANKWLKSPLIKKKVREILDKLKAERDEKKKNQNPQS